MEVVGGAVVVVVGAVLVRVVSRGRFRGRRNPAAADPGECDRWTVASPRAAIWAAMMAQTVTKRMGTSPAARPRRAGGDGIGEGS